MASQPNTGSRRPTAADPLHLLPAAERDVIALVRSQRLTYRQVAGVLGIPEEAARRHIRSGLRRLRAEMAGSGLATA